MESYHALVVPSQAVLRTLGGIVLAVLLAGGVARAQPAPAKPSDAPLPSCLDQTIAGQLGENHKPRGVQKRVCTKRELGKTYSARGAD